MKRRIFVGLPISKDLATKISLWEGEFRELPVRWLEPKNLHITIIPPWYEDNIDSIKEQLQSVRWQPFRLDLTRVRYGPNLRRPRLIWAQGPVSGGLLRLKDSLERVLRKDSAIKDYLVHVTLARFEEKRFGEFKVKLLEEKVPWRESFTNFVLYESHLSRDGADYKRVAIY